MKSPSHTKSYIQRHAKKIRKDKDIPYSEALDIASKEAVCHNWQHFLRTMAEDDCPQFQAISSTLARGTWIHLKDSRMDGVVIRHRPAEKIVHLFSHEGPRMCLQNDVLVYSNQNKPIPDPMRLYLPYGKRILENGSEVLFSCDGLPIWLKKADGSVMACDPEDTQHYGVLLKPMWLVNIPKNEVRFFDDSNPPWRDKKTFNKCKTVLKAWGVESKRPYTMDGYLQLLETGQTTDEKLARLFS